MLKVLYVSPNGYLGGAERFVLTAARSHLGSKGVEAAILFFSDGEACNEARNQGIKIYILTNAFRMRNPISFFRALREVRNIVQEFNPDILHLTMPYAHIVLSLATIGIRVKKVWFQHGPVGERFDKIASLFPVDMIWFNSQFLKDKHHESWPVASVKKSEDIIRLGIESNTKRAEDIFSGKTVRMGTAGRICYGKGFHNILKALGELKKELGILNYQLVIAGNAKSVQDKIYAEELRKLVSSLDLKNEVQFLDHVIDMNTFYRNLDVFIHASTIPEPFGLVVAEAMASGCLVIASDQGGVTDLLQNNANGIMFPATSGSAVKSLKEIVKKILKADLQVMDHFRNQAELGRLFVVNNYSVESMNFQIEKLYERLR